MTLDQYGCYRGNDHGRCCNRQRVVEHEARVASHLRCEMRAKTQGFTQVRTPEGKDLLLLDCIMERVQGRARRLGGDSLGCMMERVLYAYPREVYIGSPR